MAEEKNCISRHYSGLWNISLDTRYVDKKYVQCFQSLSEEAKAKENVATGIPLWHSSPSENDQPTHILPLPYGRILKCSQPNGQFQSCELTCGFSSHPLDVMSTVHVGQYYESFMHSNIILIISQRMFGFPIMTLSKIIHLAAESIAALYENQSLDHRGGNDY